MGETDVNPTAPFKTSSHAEFQQPDHSTSGGGVYPATATAVGGEGGKGSKDLLPQPVSPTEKRGGESSFLTGGAGSTQIDSGCQSPIDKSFMQFSAAGIYRRACNAKCFSCNCCLFFIR